ncbi:MAG: nuclear transport factor 2 family protein [Bacteroidales bacterium]|nr:nuclear transport factor 2 family protein [Bacteroidales bacterium]
MKSYLLISFIALALVFSSCQDCEQQTSLKDDQLAIENLLEQYIIANERQDFDLIQDIWAPDSDIILYGTDSEDQLMGWINIKKAVKNQFSQISETYISVSDQFIKINCSGNTGWFAERLNYNFIYKGEAHTYSGLRFTGVVEKIEGKWMLVQAHLSLPAHVGVGK